MGREIRRVPLDFDWPLKEVWHGFVNPWYQHCHDCSACDGTGLNPESAYIERTWYNHDGLGTRWCNDITQDEVRALVKKWRLLSLTHNRRSDKSGRGWVPKWVPKWIPVRLGKKLPVLRCPRAAVVNAWSRGGIAHDAINRWICVETRCRRLGVWGYCETCAGNGDVWDTPESKAFAEAWKEAPPPEGEGWQVWETVGSPVSPVFTTREGLIGYLIEQGYSGRAATAFVDGAYCPSAMFVNGKMYKDIESCGVGGE